MRLRSGKQASSYKCSTFPNTEAYPAAGKPFCSRMSRADFWVLATQTMLQEACPYSRSRLGYVSRPGATPQFLGLDVAPGTPLLSSPPLHESVAFAFRAGRIDVPTCFYNSSSARL